MDLVTFTDKILNGRLFLCSGSAFIERKAVVPQLVETASRYTWRSKASIFQNPGRNWQKEFGASLKHPREKVFQG